MMKSGIPETFHKYLWDFHFYFYVMQQPLNMVQASFHQCVWALHIVCSGNAKEAAIGQ